MSGRGGLTALAVAVVLGVVVAAIALNRSGGSRPNGSGLKTVADLAGRNVTVPERVERLVALGPGALRLVVYLRAADRVVGMEDFERRNARDVYVRPYAGALGAEFLKLPVVGPGGPGALPDPEKLLMCRPDLIVAAGVDPAQLENIQAKCGAPAVYLSYGELGVWRDEARRSLSLLGELLGAGERAAALNAYVDSLERDLRKRTGGVPAEKKPSAYFGGISYKGAHGIESTQGDYPPGRMAGARNLAGSLGRTGHFFVDREQILVWNPEFVFVDAGSRSVLDRDFEKNRAFYRLLGAARSGKTFSLLPYNYYNTNIELALINAYFVGKTLYPAGFEDLIVKEKAGEILETFLGARHAEKMPACRRLFFPETGPVKWE